MPTLRTTANRPTRRPTHGRREARSRAQALSRTALALLLSAASLLAGCTARRHRSAPVGRYTYQRDLTARPNSDACVAPPDGPCAPSADPASAWSDRAAGFPRGRAPDGRRICDPRFDPPGAASATLRDRPTLIAEQKQRLAESPGADTQNDAGRILIELGETEAGIDALRKAAELAPQELAFVLDYAAALVAAGRTEAARQALLAAPRHHADDLRLTVSLARVAETLENWDEAATHYAAASRAVESSGRADLHGHTWKRQQARCLYCAARFAEARDLFAASLAPDDPNASFAELSLFGDACLRTEDFATARLIFDELSRRTPVPSRDVELVRALCSLRQGDPAGARRIATDAMEFWPSDARLKQLADAAESTTPPSKAGERVREADRATPGRTGSPRPFPL